MTIALKAARNISSLLATLTIGLLVFVAAASPSTARELRLSDAAELARVADQRIFVIYLPGSVQEFHRDRCDPNSVGSPHGLPKALASLTGTRVGPGLQLDVRIYCTPSRIGTYQHAMRSGDPKILRRTRDLREMLTALTSAGVPREHIFVAGWSAGAWAALHVASKDPHLLNGVIAMAPAFAGPRRTRQAGWSMLRSRLASELARTHRIDALVYAFHDDAFERPRDLGFLRSLPGIRFRAMGGRASGGQDDCSARRAHLTPFASCFEYQSASIAEYIRRNLDRNRNLASSE